MDLIIGTMHIEALNNNTKIVWEKCAFLEGFYLAGGTALALQIGHRTSVDLDFFSSNPIKKTLLSEVEKVFGTVTPIIKTKDELTIILDGVKVTFLHYPFSLVSPKIFNKIIPLASVRDIASMKAYALGRRQSLKDYIDLYEIFSRKLFDLEGTITDAKNKYKGLFTDRLFLEQLLYIDDLEDEPIQWIRDVVSKEYMRDFFATIIKQIII